MLALTLCASLNETDRASHSNKRKQKLGLQPCTFQSLLFDSKKTYKRSNGSRQALSALCSWCHAGRESFTLTFKIDLSSYGYETIAQADQLSALLCRNMSVMKHCSSLLLQSIHSSQMPSPKVGHQFLIFFNYTPSKHVYKMFNYLLIHTNTFQLSI
jgi:hypothetical protein